MQGHDDVADLHRIGLARQQASIAAPGVLLVLRQADATFSKVGQMLEIEIRSIAPSLAESTDLHRPRRTRAAVGRQGIGVDSVVIVTRTNIHDIVIPA